MVWNTCLYNINCHGWKLTKMTRSHMKNSTFGVAWIVMLTTWQRHFGSLWTLEMWRLWRRDSLWIQWKLELRSMGLRSCHTYSSRSACISMGASITSIFKINMIGIMPHGRALTGKEWSQDTCHLDLWSKSRPWRASMDGSTPVGKKSKISPDAVESHKCPQCHETN